ncbi:MAG: CHAT domain-containing protein [Chlorobiaceae bacterium]|nr:CHAT domain-containing protein [Chlorobiaceae bacterium]
MNTSETGRERFVSLMAEYDTLDRESNPERAAAILFEAGTLVDRVSEPKKWAAFRSMYARYAESSDPAGAVNAYREALTVWDPVVDRDSWIACHSGIGTLMVNQEPFGPAEIDEAIMHLECAVSDQPFLSSLLAVLFRFRITGDPFENWKKRICYLRHDLQQVSREDEPVKWAITNNEQAIAAGDEPDGDFGAVLEERIRLHQESMEVLDGSHNETWIDTCCYLSECFLFRGGFETKQNLDEAERYARLAFDASAGNISGLLRAKVLLNLAKVLMSPGRELNYGKVQQALELCREAGSLLDPALSPALVASAESFQANALLKLLVKGEPGHGNELVRHAEAALSLLQGAEHLRDRRIILQVAAEGMLVEGNYVSAVSYFKQALNAAAEALAVAGSRAGRMERIWEFRDSSALLGWCLLKLGRKEEALIELERGKARFWLPEGGSCTMQELKSLVPEGGALLFPVFACPEGAVVVVTAVTVDVVWLPAFGRERLMELQRGGLEAEELGGWLRSYSFRNSEHQAWRKAIDAMGEVLYRELWQPLLNVCKSLGVTEGAELVWFPQGGSGLFPMHAAWAADSNGGRRWLLDDWTVRYAPSVRALIPKEKEHVTVSGNALLVSNPGGDLEFSELECFWVEQALSGRIVKVLHGIKAFPEAVLEAVRDAETVHFSTHAVFDLNRPLHSALLLAGGEKLTLECLLPVLALKAPRLVSLSACETGMARVSSTPDEFLGFPAAFLHAGSRTVLATLWPVDDAATAVLSGRFYRELAEKRLTPAGALREAQNWMRRVTVRELMELLRKLKSEPAPAGPLAARIRTTLRLLDPDSCPFAEPYFWAAFTISGRE